MEKHHISPIHFCKEMKQSFPRVITVCANYTIYYATNKTAIKLGG